ncbi:MAG: hypothetical protein WCT12_25520 [Verrucomicrobiota bacterium]
MVVIAAFAHLLQALSHAQVPANGYSDFAAYLTNKPWVKEMVVDLSRNRYMPSNIEVPADPFSGFSTWKGALQPGGFYFQCISNTPWTVRKGSSGVVFGESSEEFWEASSGAIMTASKRPEKGASENNGRAQVCGHFKRELTGVLNLGIEGLDNKNITWTSPKEFNSPFLNSFGRATESRIKVTVELFDGALPKRLRSVVMTGRNKTQESQITCEYSAPVLPPRRVVFRKSVNGRFVGIFTNIIQDIVFGVISNSEVGFLRSDFVSDEAAATRRRIEERNGQTYIVHSNSVQELVDDTATTAALQQNMRIGSLQYQRSSRTRIVRLTFFGLIGILPILAAIAYWRKRRSHVLERTLRERNTETENTNKERIK